MQADAFIGQDLNLPFEIRYEGMDADDHRIDMAALAESLDGFSRIYAVVGHFISTGQYAKQMQALNVKAYAQESEAKCFNISAVLDFASSAGLFQGVMGAALTAIVAYVIHRSSGNKEEMKHLKDLLEQQLGFSKQVTERMMDTIDRLSDGLRPSVKKAVSPVGDTCSRIDLYAEGKKHQTMDQSLKDSLVDDSDSQVLGEKVYVVEISEMDRIKRTCKVHLVGPDTEEGTEEDGTPRRINADITDPAALIEPNVYMEAWYKSTKLNVKAKALLRNGLIAKMYISDTA
ncbi:hypothetical protein [Pseudomonas sp. ANT_J28]|uniref:DUF7946 domain-containing protein n=1 Tax=Pseudomonas sp. ANT_J28 TaxID=2597352 RepID=UPI0011F2253E|nr:hypothetical protein [Pseudomonas sp. ANT_J28]KAA0983276.1 hypothetical protein FQ187_12735 [Pseudomonas sp. ANT_J28]